MAPLAWSKTGSWLSAGARTPRGTRCGRVVMSLLPLMLAGCASLTDPNVPEPIRANIEPEHGERYLFYRPSSYNREQSWPLVVVCHSSFPDSPNNRIRDWTLDAERTGFLVLAPRLAANRKDFPPKPDAQLELLKQDEEHILAAIRHVRAAHTISEDRVFLHGFAGGARPALYTGLKHPEVFRAVTLSQPRFDKEYLAGVVDFIDPHQPIFVERNITDAVTGRHARRCVDWLCKRTDHVTEETSSAASDAGTSRHVGFFEHVVRTIPWIRIRALPGRGKSSMTVQFKSSHSTTPTRMHWSFGDGTESTLTEPLHVYETPGTFRVELTVHDTQGIKHRRTIYLAVPQLTTRHTPPTMEP
jgi:hypothetical protein